LSKDISRTNEDLISFSRDTIQMLHLPLFKNPLTNSRIWIQRQVTSKIQSVLPCLQIPLR